jgi:hypothetical protein
MRRSGLEGAGQNLSHALAGQNVGVTQVGDRVWLVSFMKYDLGYFDDRAGRTDRQSIRSQSVTHVSGINCHPCDRNRPFSGVCPSSLAATEILETWWRRFFRQSLPPASVTSLTDDITPMLAAYGDDEALEAFERVWFELIADCTVSRGANRRQSSTNFDRCRFRGCFGAGVRDDDRWRVQRFN